LLSFSEFLQTSEGKVCVAKGDYHSYIANWLKVVCRDQVCPAISRCFTPSMLTWCSAQLLIVGFTPLIKRSSATLAALASFLNIPSWPANYTFPMPRKHTNYETGLRCTDRDRLVSGRIFTSLPYVCMYVMNVYVYRWCATRPSTRSSPRS